jgi:hypothetical protein
MTAEERALITTQLSEARTALHELVIGGKPRVVVDQNGERVEYTQARKSDLQSYISRLERQLAGATARPLRVWF